MQVTAVVWTHHAFTRHSSQQEQDGLPHRSVVRHHVDTAGSRESQSGKLLRSIDIRMQKTPGSIASSIHFTSDTKFCCTSSTWETTTPGGVPSVNPFKVSRQIALPLTVSN